MKQFEEKHQHNWVLVKGKNEMICLGEIYAGQKCNVIGIGYFEYVKRRKEWEEYYPKVEDTKSRKRFTAQKNAYLAGKMDLVKAFSEKAKEQILNNDWELKEPSFPDPLFEKNAKKLE